MYRNNLGKPPRAETLNATIYEDLALLDSSCHKVDKALSALRHRKVIRKDEARYFRALVKEIRAYACQSVVEAMNREEIRIASLAERKRRKLERALFEPTAS